MGYTWACWICVGCHFRRQCNCSHRHRSCCPLRLIRCYVGDLRQTVGDLRQTAGDLRQTAGDLRQTGWVTRGWHVPNRVPNRGWHVPRHERPVGGTCRAAARAEPHVPSHVPSDRTCRATAERHNRWSLSFAVSPPPQRQRCCLGFFPSPSEHPR